MKLCFHLILFILFCFACNTLSFSSTGATSWNYRTWATKDGLFTFFCQTMEIAQDGTIYVVHDFFNNMSILDGFSVRWIPSPMGNNYDNPPRVIKSHTNQIWANHPEGIQLFQDNNWTLFSLPELQPAWTALDIKVWAYQQLPYFAPFDHNRIITINAEQIFEFNATDSTLHTLKSAQDTGLEAFISIQRSKQDGFWITGTKGMAKITIDSSVHPCSIQWEEFLLPNELPVTWIGRVFEFQSGQIYVETFDTRMKQNILLQFTESQWIKKTMAPLPEEFNRREVWPGIDGSLWCFSNRKLYHLINNRSQIFENMHYRDFTVESNGVFWLATTLGLKRFAPQPWQIDSRFQVENGMRKNGLYVDPNNRFWILDAVGVHHMKDGQIIRTYPWPSQLAFKVPVSSMAMLPDNRLALADQEYILLLLDPDTGHFQLVSHPDPDKSFLKITRLSSNEVVVIINKQGDINNGYEEFDGEQFTPFIETVHRKQYGLNYDITRVRNGDLWITTTNGVIRYRNGKYELANPLHVEHDEIFKFALEDNDGVIWLSGSNKLYQLHGDQVKIVLENTGSISSMTQAKDGAIWLTSDNGIYCYKNNTWMLYNEEDGLTSMPIRYVLEDEAGNIWAQTQQGVYRFFPHSDTDSPETFVAEADNLKMISHNGEARFIFSGKDKWKYTRTDRLYFSYQMDQQEWSPFRNEMVASFSNLPAGKHTFRVKAMDVNWNVDPDPAVWDFEVLLPWYREPGFLLMSICGSLLTLVSIGYALHRHFDLEKLVSSKTKELMTTTNHILRVSEHEQQRIGYELHDGVVQDLSAIAMSAEYLMYDLQKKKMKEAKELKELVQWIDQSAQQVRRLARGLAPIDLDATGLQWAFEELSGHVGRLYHIPCFFDQDLPFPITDKQLILNLYRLAQEAVNNAAKHSKATQIFIRLSQNNGSVILSVEDNGMGYDIAQCNGKGMGYHIMCYRAKILNATIDIQSQPSKGTTITCSIPLTNGNATTNEKQEPL